MKPEVFTLSAGRLRYTLCQRVYGTAVAAIFSKDGGYFLPYVYVLPVAA